MSESTSVNAQVRITADDYGLSPHVNEAIEDLSNRLAIDAVSIMVHRNADLTTIHRLGATNVLFGIHLVFTEFAGLIKWPTGETPSHYLQLFKEVISSRHAQDAVRNEAVAQLERYSSLKLPLHFINSHHHVHLFPMIWPIVVKLANEFKVTQIRTAIKHKPSFSRRGLVTVASKISNAVHPIHNMTQLVPIGINYSGALVGSALRTTLSFPKRQLGDSAVWELVVHPENNDRPDDRSQEKRSLEYQMLQDVDGLNQTLLNNGMMRAGIN